MGMIQRNAFGALVLGLAAWLAVVLCSTGCEPGASHYVESADIRTGGLWVDYEIEEVVDDDGDFSVLARARFSVAGPLGTRVLLTEGDAVEVNGVPMENVPGAIWPRYEAAIDMADTYEFVFTRPDEGSYVSNGTPPPVVNMSAPDPGETYSRSEPLSVAWENNNAGGTITVRVGPNTDGYVQQADDNGAYTVPASPLVWVDAGQLTFDAFVRLRRSNTGTMDSGLSGKLTMYNRRTVTFRSVP